MENILGRSIFLPGILAAIFMAACATTEVKSVWKDASYAGHPARIMVIGVSRSPLKRRFFEDEFVQQLKGRGTDAIASYTVLPDTKQNDQDVVAKKVKEQRADTVLITRLVSKRTVQIFVPGTVYYPPFYYGTWPILFT